MTIAEIQALVVAIDPDAQHYTSAKKTAAYTTWHEVQLLGAMSNDRHDGAWQFQVDRFTKAENDTMAASIMAVLESNDRVAFSYMVDREEDTGYIHHIFLCEAM